MEESVFISRLLAPLARSAPTAQVDAFGLSDDVGVVLPSCVPVIVTTDTIVENVHFFASDPLDMTMRKAIRTNVSDVVAKGALPFAYMTAMTMRRGGAGEEEWEKAVLAMQDEQKRYGMTLLGGDTTSHHGPLVITVTMFGKSACPGVPLPLRRNMRAGDFIYVTGTVGDAAALPPMRSRPEAFRGVSEPSRQFLTQRYVLPEPRVEAAPWVARHASASMDVSDGLLGDLANMAKASGVGVTLDVGSVPRSSALMECFRAGAYSPERADGGGDDYEILFAAPSSADFSSFPSSVRVTRIGKAAEGSGVEYTGEGAERYRALNEKDKSYSHDV
ncbi:MAG: thiamine-phosphate kinase [Rickettsiales bacterium]